jgi:hypothetical protein
MGIYASVAGRYKLGGQISRHQYFFNQQECCQSHPCINTCTLHATLIQKLRSAPVYQLVSL